jgi:hypothetical protein
MASIWKPPPGITTTAAPVFLPPGEYTVMVGRVTLVTAPVGAGFRSRDGLHSGATPGQIGIWV